MANTKSAKKAARQAVARTEVNKSRTSRARTAVRSVEEAIAAGKKDDAANALKVAAPVLARNAQKGVLHKKTASRKVSRLSARVKAMAMSALHVRPLQKTRCGKFATASPHRPPSPHEFQTDLSDGFRDARASRRGRPARFSPECGDNGAKWKMTFWRRIQRTSFSGRRDMCEPLEIMNLLSPLSTGAVSNSQDFHCYHAHSSTSATERGAPVMLA